ncbi:hypothetical protein O181_036288 [Austropuccinia psidii MF-1]|uniref:Tim44-like domain-containing protein n=1 Tax=Austropuccinia psidii MF-1 TaxID=1389203 RepID=A0A9Q3D981_9BASI|nr:hypothetical protein [Austropuccinia psidii MF-1]
MHLLLPRLAVFQLRVALRYKHLGHEPFRRSYSAISSASTSPQLSLAHQEAAGTEFDEEIEKELAKLPAKRAQEARRRLRNERRAELNGLSMERQDNVIIPYIPPYEGPNPDSSQGLWTHLKVGWRKNRMRDAWGQWLGARQAKKNVDLILSPSNSLWMQDFVEESYESIIFMHQTLASNDFENPRVKKLFHPAMIEFLQSKRGKLVQAYSSSHFFSWKKHAPIPESDKRGKPQPQEKELNVVAMRAAPFDKGGTLVQIAVRFRSLQSFEVRDERGLLVFGSHTKPESVMEYFIFQKRMGQVNQPFLLFRQYTGESYLTQFLLMWDDEARRSGHLMPASVITTWSFALDTGLVGEKRWLKILRTR